MTFPAPRPLHAITFLALAAATLTLAACSSAAGTSMSGTHSPATSAAETAGEVVSGTGSTGWPGTDFAIPDGTRSLAITFDCEGEGQVMVELGDSMMLNQAVLSGSCSAPIDMTWPVTSRTDPRLAVTVPDAAKWTATPTFSTAEFAYDDALTADCSGFTDAYSAVVNAEDGFRQYNAFDKTEWARRIQTAAADLAHLGETSTSDLARPFSVIADKVAAVAEPGKVMVGTEPEMAEITSACNINQTPFFVKAEFGG